jgi:transketolase
MVPQRHLEMGIAEQNMAGVAAGLASCGKIPFVHSFACFISMRSCEQIRTSICYPALNVKFIATHGGLFAGSAGSTHHALEDIAIMRSMPNMTIISPGDAAEARSAIKTAVKHNGPVYIRIAKDDAEDVFDASHKFTIGKAEIAAKGKDGCIITTGVLLAMGLEAAKVLRERHNIRVRVLHCASIKPIDTDSILKAAKETRNIITLEEHSVIGGLGGAVSEIVAAAGKGRVIRLGINDHFSGIGTQAYLFEKEGITIANIVKNVIRLVKSK